MINVSLCHQIIGQGIPFAIQDGRHKLFFISSSCQSLECFDVKVLFLTRRIKLRLSNFVCGLFYLFLLNVLSTIRMAYESLFEFITFESRLLSSGTRLEHCIESLLTNVEMLAFS